MPELPEVETTVKDLQTKVLSRTFIDVWTDLEKFKKLKELKNKKIQKIWRRGKNIIFELFQAPLEVNGSKKKHQENKPLTGQGYSLLVHQKLTGHLLIGNWKATLRGVRLRASREIGNWEPLKKGPLKEPVNHYIHLMFWLSGDLMLALSDLRKFAKVELWKTNDLIKELSSLGPEPLSKNFTFEKFKEVLKGKRGKVKQILMDQEVIAGIGNIYSDEVLWRAKIHPFREVFSLKEEELKKIYQAIKKILPEAIKLGGESISDYRNPEGEKGNFDKIRKVYRREGESCSRCGVKIKRIKIAGRSAHFCPHCQKP